MVRPLFRSPHAFKLGLFSANTSGGAGFTTVPERWRAGWDENLEVAHIADDAGLDFLIPVARYLGYGGAANYQQHSLDPVGWAAGLLASTRNITVFSTVHTAFTHPVLAAKQFATLDAIGRGRFAVNVVCGWNSAEYRLFGLELPAEHRDRYALGAEWLHIVRRLLAGEAAFDFEGEHFKVLNATTSPGQFDGEPLPIMNAGASAEGRDFAARHSDILFTTMLEPDAQAVQKEKDAAARHGRSIEVLTGCYVVCRPTRAEALDYHRYYAEEHADEAGVDRLLEALQLNAKSFPPELFSKLRIRFAAGHGGYPLVGSPDDVADGIARIAEAGYFGCTLGFVNYLDELPYFRDEVLPRLVARGLRRA
ncbi:LLM class flavin-dependent oxidoreductase [soil metagenome]